MVWDQLSFKEKKFVCCFVAYAAGDAFGAYYEFSEISRDIPNTLKKKKDWPTGGTSDDTRLTTLTLLSLEKSEPNVVSRNFINLLQRESEKLQGLGPTTRAALGLPVKDFEQDSIGLTNGAMMRTALLGLIYPNRDERVRIVRALAESTHIKFAVEKAIELSDLFASEDKLLMKSEWQPPSSGVSNEAQETFAAVIYVAERSQSIIEAIRISCSLGGDTDTVAALSAALVASRTIQPEVVFEIPWLAEVDWNGIPDMRKALGNAFRVMTQA
jgi:ADP-ribosylglycohydrolase